MDERSERTFLGTGWTFPPRFDNASMHLLLSSGEANINQSIDLLLGTPRGSRSLQPDIGSDLARYVFRRLDATMTEEIVQSVKTTLLNGEPRITVDKVDVSSPDGTIVYIAVTYHIRTTNTRHNHVFPFSLAEGTNL
ncbi:GPW/gp25 family protein [Massilia solisilvae]|uniref:GPW/gp25 family protein n=1 Tax=Massilia solisilvae TaxID=1811225 RepID=A0ABT2BPD7_9BURK|nr:GPW/gp25 family protein [Massilia solisilvae]MCS0610340.1 GPW/gp25 family protein [Massilia solisilvae]